MSSVVIGLQHVALPYPGTTEAAAGVRAFYGEALGLAEIPVLPPLDDSILWFSAGGQEIHIYPEPSGVAVNSESRRHACLQVSDVDAYRCRLTERGVETIDGEPAIPGRPRFFALDPFGNALEFLELTPKG
ncbi:MAG: VOC family protein [Candidatus Limnocylindrales bacterium]